MKDKKRCFKKIHKLIIIELKRNRNERGWIRKDIACEMIIKKLKGMVE